MAFQLNEARVIGRAGKDAEVVTFQNGTRLVKINLGISKSYKDKEGNWQDKTTWMRITYSSSSDAAVDRVAGIRKGDELYVEGSLENNSYEKDGAKVTSTEIRANNIQINRKDKDSAPSTPSAPAAPSAPQKPTPSAPAASSEDDDDLPF